MPKPSQRELIERVVEQQDQLYGLFSDLNADVRATMVEVYGEGTTYGLKTRVQKLEVAAGVSKKWAATITTLISATIVAGVTAVKTLFFSN